MKGDPIFDQWVAWAEQRAVVMLANGVEVTLVGVSHRTRACKVKLATRHYRVWVEDIVLIRPEPDASTWVQPEEWALPEGESRHPLTHRTSSSPPSSSWLTVQRDPRLVRSPR
jgi:hypothetical protein